MMQVLWMSSEKKTNCITFSHLFSQTSCLDFSVRECEKVNISSICKGKLSVPVHPDSSLFFFFSFKIITQIIHVSSMP